MITIMTPCEPGLMVQKKPCYTFLLLLYLVFKATAVVKIKSVNRFAFKQINLLEISFPSTFPRRRVFLSTLNNLFDWQ